MVLRSSGVETVTRIVEAVTLERHGGSYALGRIANGATSPIACSHGKAAMNRRFIALVIFKEGQRWAAQCARNAVARARAFLECRPDEIARPKGDPPERRGGSDP
jgi:hypothetical protein